MLPFAFQPTNGTNVAIAATTTSDSAPVATMTPGGRLQVRVVNDGTTVAFVKFGSDDSVTATDADIPVLGGSAVIFSATIPDGGTLYAAALMASGTANIYLQPGVGIS